MNKKNRLLLFLLTSGFFLFLDRFLKHLSIYNFTAPKIFQTVWGWQPYLNPGMAFNLPLPDSLIVLLSTLIIALIIYLVCHCERFLSCLALCLVLSGAISNLFDRLFFGKTVDYFIIFNVIFNLADIIIIIGLFLFVSSNWREPAALKTPCSTSLYKIKAGGDKSID